MKSWMKKLERRDGWILVDWVEEEVDGSSDDGAAVNGVYGDLATEILSQSMALSHRQLAMAIGGPLSIS